VEFTLQGEPGDIGREANKGGGSTKKVVAEGSARPSITIGKSFKPDVSNGQNMCQGQGETKVCLEVTPCEEMLEVLACCFVGELVHEVEVGAVQMSMVMEGITQVKVTTIGVSLVLLKLEDQGDIGRIKDSHLQWWNATFKGVKKWYPEWVVVKMIVWLNVFGIPLYVWDEPLFKLLGSKYGVFLWILMKKK